jgi:hypothetical protein
MPLPACSLSTRVVTRLTEAEAQERDPWLRDDLRIARLTVAYAANGEATLCSPDVLASYMVLGLHPDKVWPAIQARRKALLGPLYREVLGAAPVPKKPPQAVPLWCEKTNAAKAVNLCGNLEPIFSATRKRESMSAIAALYRNSSPQTSGKKRLYTLEELKHLVRWSGAPASIVNLTLAALEARGKWPGEDGPVTPIICVAIKGMIFDAEGSCCRRTVQRRIKRACKLQFWRRTHRLNRWLNCPNCGAARETGTCASCGYKGRSLNPDGSTNVKEFCRPFTYEINIEQFRSAPRTKDVQRMCRGLGTIEPRTYAEYKEAAAAEHKETAAAEHRETGVHSNVAEMPSRKPAQPGPTPQPQAPAVSQPQREKPHTVVNTEISARSQRAAELIFEMCHLADVGAKEQIAISVVAESKRQGIEIEEAGKFIAEQAIEAQRNRVPLTRFYFRDTKWRTSDGGGQRQTAAQGRAERSQQSLTSAWHKFKNAESERAGTGQADSLDPNQLKE